MTGATQVETNRQPYSSTVTIEEPNSGVYSPNYLKRQPVRGVLNNYGNS